MVSEEGASGEAPGRNAGAFVQALLDLRDTYNRFLQESFTGDQQFKIAIASVSQHLTLSIIHHNCTLHVKCRPIYMYLLLVHKGTVADCVLTYCRILSTLLT